MAIEAKLSSRTKKNKPPLVYPCLCRCRYVSGSSDYIVFFSEARKGVVVWRSEHPNNWPLGYYSNIWSPDGPQWTVLDPAEEVILSNSVEPK